MSIILGIDPGSRITGYGIIHKKNDKLIYISSGCINIKFKNFHNRLKIIYAGIVEIINKFKPNYFAIEKVFVDKNPDSALKLCQARGVAIVAAMNNNIPVFEYAASFAKQTVTGTGFAKKNQIQYMVRTMLKLSSNPQEDAADALAIAITHCHINKKI